MQHIIIDLYVESPAAFTVPYLKDGEVKFALPHWAYAEELTHVALNGYRHASHPMQAIAREMHRHHMLCGERLPDCVVVTLHEEIEDTSTLTAAVTEKDHDA